MDQAARELWDAIKAKARIGDWAALQALGEPLIGHADVSIRALAHRALHEAYWIRGDLPQARVHANAALDAARMEGVPPAILSHMLCSCANLFMIIEENPQGVPVYAAEALKVSRLANETWNIAEAYETLGSYAIRTLNNPDAMQASDQALQAALNAHDVDLQIAALNLRGIVKINFERKAERGAVMLRQALNLAKKHDSRVNECIIAANAAFTIAQTRGFQSYLNIEQLVGRALELAQSMGFVYGELIALHSLSFMHQRATEFDQALGAIERYETLARAHGFYEWVWIALGQKGMIKRTQRDYDGAIALFEQQLVLENKPIHAEFNILMSIGTTYYQSKRKGKAVEYWRQAEQAAHTAMIDHNKMLPFVSRVIMQYQYFLQRLMPGRR